MIHQALDLARTGLPIFPCAANKQPLVSGGFKSATTDPETVANWWTQFPHALPGVATGEPSGIFVLDVDRHGAGKDGFASLKALGIELPETRCHETPSGGAHYLFKNDPSLDLTISAGKLGAGLDTRADGGYVIWWPSQGYDVTNPDEILPVPKWIPDRLGRKQEHTAQDEPGTIGAGQRNDHLFRLASSMRGKGLSVAAIEAALLAENRVRCNPPLPDDEVRKIAGSAGSYVPGGDTKTSAKDGDSPWDTPPDVAAMLRTTPAPIPWLIENRIQLGRGVLLTGIGGSSKTRLNYHLAIAAAIGRLPWDWSVCATGKSILVLTEDTLTDVHRTLWGTCGALGLTDDERRLVAQRVVCYPLAGQDCKLLGADPSSRALFQNGTLKQLEAKINELGDVVLVGIDPALSITPGSEEDQGHQRALGKMADDLAVRTMAAVVLVTHASKASVTRDEMGSHNARGGGAITDAVRGEFSMRTMTLKEAKAAGIDDTEERKRHVQLLATKGNHLPPSAFVEIWLRRGEHGVLTAANLEFSTGGNGSVTGGDLKVLTLLKTLCADHTPRLNEWRDACVTQGLIQAGLIETQTKTMQRIVRKLLSEGLIVKGVGRGIYTPADGDDDE